MKKRICAALLSLLLCLSALPVSVRAVEPSQAEADAGALKALGLFRGVSDTEYDLDRAPTRTEALVMLIRVLGKEQEALTGNWSHPFTDVADWANPYVGYGFSMGLTNGVSKDQFGTGNAGAEMYLTFMLRALGYTDGVGMDFLWNDPYALSRQVGLLSERVDTKNFLRADVVLVSRAALEAYQKDSRQTLAEKLISEGVFSQADYDTVVQQASQTPRQELTARDVYARCAPAVFCIDTYDALGNSYGMGSGFFIDSSGIAVTNHHVLENAVSAKATLTDGSELDVIGVLYYDQNLDYAVIRVAGSGFPALTLGDSSTVAGGDPVFAIGNPEGLNNTITDGIVSNPRRDDYNGMIQISAPISHGSSGGALINAYGEAVGVTTGMITSGQNLNFAVPINAALPHGSPAEYESSHGYLTMQQYAAENGYTGVGIGANNGGGANSTWARRTEAFQSLIRYIQDNQTETVSNSRVSVRNQVDGASSWRAIYDSATGEVILAYTTMENGARWYSYLFLQPNRSEIYTKYSYYASGERVLTAEGNVWITPEMIYNNAIYSFSDYNGPDELRSTCEQRAMQMYCLTLQQVSGIFSTIGDYTLSDLGFRYF